MPGYGFSFPNLASLPSAQVPRILPLCATPERWRGALLITAPQKGRIMVAARALGRRTEVGLAVHAEEPERGRRRTRGRTCRPRLRGLWDLQQMGEARGTALDRLVRELRSTQAGRCLVGGGPRRRVVRHPHTAASTRRTTRPRQLL